MTTKDEALKRAFEALESATNVVEGEYGCDDPLAIECRNTITAIREALAQPAGERGELVQDIHLIQTKMVGSMLFDQTDVAVLSKAAALLSADAQPSSWVGLSDEETAEAWFVADGMHNASAVVKRRITRAIEAKLREKNARKDMPAAADKAGGDEPVAEVAEDFIFFLRKQPNGERWPKGTKLYVQSKTELEKDAAWLLFALQDAWPYVHGNCTIESIRKRIIALMRKHGDFADMQLD